MNYKALKISCYPLNKGLNKNLIMDLKKITHDIYKPTKIN